MDISMLPPGLFKTLLMLWDLLRNTYVKVYEFFGEFGFGDHGTMLTVMIGAGLFTFIGLKVARFFVGLLPI